MNKIDSKIINVKKKLSKLYKKNKLLNLLKGLLTLIIITLILNLILSVLELLGLNSVNDRTILFNIGILVFFVSLFLLIVLPAVKIFMPLKANDFYNLAQITGDYFPDINDKLLNTIQLYEDQTKSELKEEAIFSELQKMEKYNFNLVIPFSVLKKNIIFSFLTIILSVILFASFPLLQNATQRIINYSKEYIVPQKYIFYIEPQNITVTKGERVLIKIDVLGAKPSFVTLFYKDKENQNYQTKILTPDSSKIFYYSINSIVNTTNYYVLAEEVSSDEFTISVLDKPIIAELELKVNPPNYTKLESFVQKDNGNIFAVVGSKVNLSISSNKELSNGIVYFSDRSKAKLNLNNNIGNVLFTVKENLNYKIEIRDVNNNINDSPIEYKITSIVDEFPIINILQPTADVELTKTETISTAINIKDDYGFNKLNLNYKLISTKFGNIDENYSPILIPINYELTNQDVFYLWNLSDLMLASRDAVSFYFELFDNDVISGPKSVKSKVYHLRVPTLEELFKNADEVQNEAKKDIEKTLKEAEKLKEDIKKLSNELKKDEKEITWNEKQKLKETAERFEKLQNEIKETQKKIDATKEKLEENNLLSKETLHKYNELQKLMDEMNSEEMKKAFEQIQKGMQTLNRDKAQQSMDNMQFDEEMFKKSIERTVSLLKRIQIEQKMDEIIKRTEALEKETKELKEETKKNNLSEESKQKQLSKKEKNIAKQLEQLKAEMQDLKDKMGEFKEMPNQKMEELQKEMEAQKNEEITEQMKEMLQKNNKEEALDKMQQLAQNMEKMKSQMTQMQQQNQMEVIFEMMKGINNLLSLSKEEESLKNSLEQSSLNSEQLINKIQKQKELSDGLDNTLKNLAELSQKTFAISPEMGKALGNAKKDMNNAMQSMQNGNSSMVMLSQKGAMKYLNEAATMMKGNMEQMMKGGGQGGGMMSLMQQMQQMAKQQMNINKITKQLNNGQLTPQQQAEIQRLSQQQEMVRKSLEQLNKETKERGESKTLASNLEKILEEMKEVILNMNTNKIDDDLVQSQEKILSKLLDAQRSINERDFEKNRESNSGKSFFQNSPEDLNLNLERSKITDELMKLINEGYSKDYEELIKKYFDVLEKEKENIK